MSLQFVLLSLALLSSGIFSAPAEDLIVDLPGLNYQVNFNQYSGYLKGTTGRNLHYWFVESQNDPPNDPLFLWLNGGPGCSSLMGLLTELGPFTVADDGTTLIDNPYSWNKIANIIFLESPACVGFSYDDNNNCATGDKEVAEMNYLAIQDFFSKFPEYLSNDFYIIGESYGGIYVPTLTVKVLEGNDTFPIRLAGYAIGNGLFSYKNNDNSLMFYSYYHAIFDQTLWDNLISSCCQNGVESKETCDFYENLSERCQLAVTQAYIILYFSGLNIYNLYGTCDTASSTRRHHTEYTMALRNLFRKVKLWKESDPVPYDDPPCLDNSDEREYLNSEDVRTALHIPNFVQDWDICSNTVAQLYNRQYDATTPQLKVLHDNNIRGLIYNGDTDMSCNFLGNDWDILTLGLEVVASRRKWIVDNDVAGYCLQYEYLDFVTVRGSGHMVPEYKPPQGLHMITSFVNKEPY